ncbi:TolC family protein [Spirosoma utsteinense]|uniref:Outer membrane protein TolC n=1 Tax=Spirosoma utsteinense TaxID=2585773 RepID=A0ABR6VZR8_9BACT|nr:TolC family protein [Spirosoma utsteinense]MBC3784526.1 outer membrane protein TolC [Spirosoma utsteinense]MBC3789723.1 outer membrane protein TolC [Spirosoma utsteinense]
MNRLSLLFLLLFSMPAGAQTVVTNVQEVLALARRNNPDLVNARQNRLVQEQQRAATQASLMPAARLFTNFDYNYALPVQLVPAEFLGGRPGEFREFRFGLPFFLTAGIEVNVPIVNRPARADRGIVGQNLQIIDDQNLVLQDEISTQIARIYHAAILTRSAIAITRRNLLAADTLSQIARQRLTKGLIEPLEYNRIRAVQLTTTDVLFQNELAYVRNLNQLRLLLGLAPADSLHLSEDLSDRPVPESLPVINTVERPQVTLRQARLDLARLQLDRERLQRWPTLAAYGRYTQQAQRNQLNFLNPNERWFTIGVTGLQFNWAIYSGGLRANNLTRARLQLKLAESELAYERNRQQTDTDDVRQSYNQALRSLELNRQNFELSNQNVQIALVKYRSGLFAYDQYLNVFNEALSAQNRFLTNLSNVFINQTILQLRHGQ